MKVFYVNEESRTVIGLNTLKNLHPNTKITVNYDDRNVEYTLDDIYNCRDWKVYTHDDYSLTLDDVRELMKIVDNNTDIYNKLKIEESRMLDIWTEEVTSDFQQERSLF